MMAVLGKQSRPTLEVLEERRVLTTFTVTTEIDVVANDGLTSLREAIFMANQNPDEDIIEFDTAFGTKTIELTDNHPPGYTMDGELIVTESVTIGDLKDSANVTIKPAPGLETRVFKIGRDLLGSGGGLLDSCMNDMDENVGLSVTLNRLTIEGGTADLVAGSGPVEGGYGGGVYAVNTNLQISDSRITDSRAVIGGGVYHGRNRCRAWSCGDGPLHFREFISIGV